MSATAAYQPGRPLIARRGFVYDGREYKAGRAFATDGLAERAIQTLWRARYVAHAPGSTIPDVLVAAKPMTFDGVFYAAGERIDPAAIERVGTRRVEAMFHRRLVTSAAVAPARVAPAVVTSLPQPAPAPSAKLTKKQRKEAARRG